MYRSTQNTADARAWPKPQTRRSTGVAQVIEYGLLAMLIMTVVAIGATFAGSKINGAFGAVASAIERAGSPKDVFSYGQRTNRKGAPVDRNVSGKISPLTSLSPEPSFSSKER